MNLSSDELTAIAAACAALAAFGSAVAAAFSLQQQRRSVRNEVRPNVNLEDLTVEDNGDYGTLRIGKLKNFSSAPAYSVRVDGRVKHEGAARLMDVVLPPLQPGCDIAPDWVVTFRWDLGTRLDEDSYLVTFALRLYWFDLYGNEYEPRYTLHVKKGGAIWFGEGKISENLYMVCSPPIIRGPFRRKVNSKVGSTVKKVKSIGNRLRRVFSYAR